MTFELPYVGSVLNIGLIKEPLNWAIVMVFATVALLGMHVIMQAFGAMQSTTQPAFAGPGQIAIPAATGVFSQPGTLAGSNAANDLSPFLSGGMTGLSPWTDGIESKFAEDGWASN